MSLKLLLLTSVALPFLAQAQDARPPVRRQIVRATGEAALTAKPDQARLSVGVITDAATAEEAMQQNATQTTAVLDALKNVVGTGGEVKTSNYSVSPQYKYEQGHSPVITGYQASNTVDVTLSDLSLIGKVIDAVGACGREQHQQHRVYIKERSGRAREGDRRGDEQAQANAEAIAQALNVRVVGLASAETVEGGGLRPITPMFSVMGRQAMEAPTPVETGTLRRARDRIGDAGSGEIEGSGSRLIF